MPLAEIKKSYLRHKLPLQKYELTCPKIVRQKIANKNVRNFVPYFPVAVWNSEGVEDILIGDWPRWSPWFFRSGPGPRSSSAISRSSFRFWRGETREIPLGRDVIIGWVIDDGSVGRRAELTPPDPAPTPLRNSTPGFFAHHLHLPHHSATRLMDFR